MESIRKQQLLESLGYIEITRGATRPLPLDEILQRRMEDFIARRLKIISGSAAAVSLRDL